MARRIILSGLLLLLLAGPAWAGKEESQWYGGAGLGSADVDLGVISDGTVTNASDDTKGELRKFFLGHPLNFDFIKFKHSIEFGYVDFPKPEFSGTADGSGTLYGSGTVGGRGEANGLTVAGVVWFPMIPNFDAFAKLGIMWWDSDTALVNSKDQNGIPRPTLTFAEDGFDLFLGGGVQYRINDTVSVRGELELFQLDYRNADGTDITALTVDAILHF